MKEPYYTPCEVIDGKVGKYHVLSKMDLFKGFHQVGVRECDRAKTTFITLPEDVFLN